MPLPTPNLDDRRFQDIVDEAKRLIPRYTPQWTDHNVSDPGVTLIELFAWMVEMMLFRLNRVPDKSYITFMNLLGVRLQPAVAAQVPLTFWLASPPTEPVLIPINTEVTTVQTAAEFAVTFSTNTDLVVRPAELKLLFTSPDERQFEDQWWKLDVASESFNAFSATPQPGDAFYLGFRYDHSDHLLVLTIDAAIQGIGVDPTNAPLAWEAWCSEGWTEAELERDEAGRPNDETGGLNKRGALVLLLPGGMALHEINGKRAYWLRCRYTTPQPNQPTYTASPKIHALQAAALGATVGATHATTVVGELLGRSDGMPGQHARLEYPPVLPRRGDEMVELQNEEGGWVAWEERTDFAESQPTDLHVVVDSVSGDVSFGPFMREPDGSGRQYGAVPPRGALMRMHRYRSGGGVHGNVDRGKLTVLKSTVPYVDRVMNRQRATGGRDAETLEHAKLRAPQALRTRDRAVTSEDFEFLALQASPGVARAKCLQPRAVGAGGAAPGTVQVLLVPDISPREGRLLAEQFVLGQAVRQAVQQYLDDRRMLTTVVALGPPQYLFVRVEVRIKARREADPDIVQRDALAQLYRFLNPLAGGVERTGWPFGRDLYISEVFAVLQNVAGVEYIEQVNMYLDGADGIQARIVVPPNGLVASAEHRVVVV